MNQKINKFVILFFFTSLYCWNTESNKNSLKVPIKNVCGMLDGTALENINFNNGQIEQIACYEKPVDEKNDPRFRQFLISIIPSAATPYVKQIIFNKNDEIKKTVKYGSEYWYEVTIVYSNNESQVVLLPVTTKIYAKNARLNRLETIEIPRLLKDGLEITQVKEVKVVDDIQQQTSGI